MSKWERWVRWCGINIDGIIGLSLVFWTLLGVVWFSLDVAGVL